jgi:hypothetical protein
MEAVIVALSIKVAAAAAMPTLHEILVSLLFNEAGD